MYMLAHEDEQAILWGKRALDLAEAGSGARGRACIKRSWSPATAKEVILKQVSGASGKPTARTRGRTDGSACRGYYNLGVELQRKCRYRDAIDQFDQLSAYGARNYAKPYANERCGG